MASKQNLGTATIANGATVSSAIALNLSEALGLIMPAAFTGTVLSFQTAGGDNNYQPLYDISGELVQIGDAVSAPVAAGRNYDLPGEVNSWVSMKIVSNLAEGAPRSIIVVGRALEE